MGVVATGTICSNACGGNSGMDQGSDFECEFRARRIRLRGNFAHKLFSEIIHSSPVGRYTPMTCMPMRSRSTPMRSHAYEIHAYEIHAHEIHAHEIHAHEMHAL